MDWLSLLFDTSSFRRRWDCGVWTTTHGYLHIFSDLGVWSAYIAIPCVLGYFLLRRKDLPFRTVFILFGVFILACGTTHLMEALMYWWPAYRLAGAIKLCTAVVSWATVAALIPVTPQALAMRSPDELEAEIKERKHAEVLLRQNEEQLRLLVEGTEHAIYLLDTHGNVVSWNAGAERLKGYRAEDIIGQHMSRFYPAEDVRQGKCDILLKTAEAKGHSEDEGWRLRKDGSRFWANEIITALRDSNGTLKGYTKSTRDLTERRQAEAALEESRRFIERIAVMMPSILYVYDLKEDRNVFINNRIESILGYAAEQTKRPGMAVFEDNIHPDDWPRVARTNEQFTTAANDAVIENEYRIRHANGEWRWLHTRATVFVRDEHGKPRQILGTAQDITERKRLEQEVLEVAAMEQRRIGRELHEGTGQELTGLCMLADALIDNLREDSPGVADKVQRISQGLRSVLGQVKAQSRGLIPVEVDAEGLMTSLGELAKRISEVHAVRCTFECAKPVPVEDNFTATQLYQIAQEATSNAIKHALANHIRISLETNGESMTLKIADDGIGLPPLRKPDEGMGLRIMQYRAGQIGGHFYIRPGPARGTLVSCTLFRGRHDE